MIVRAFVLFVLSVSVPAAAAYGETTRVAAAANFLLPAKEVATAFHEETGHRALLSFGSTGTLFAQISQGAPHDVFLSADRERAVRAEAEGLAVSGSVFVYAVGRLALFSPGLTGLAARDGLDLGTLERLAVANPVTAPYGRAAMEVMDARGMLADYTGRLVRGNNIAQTFQFVATGNADAGFVALSQVIDRPAESYWPVPHTLHAPIEQAAVLLERGRENPAAAAFVDFLRGPKARAIIRRFGYDVME